MRKTVLASAVFAVSLLTLALGCQKNEPEATPSPEATAAAPGTNAAQPGANPTPNNTAEVLKSSQKD